MAIPRAIWENYCGKVAGESDRPESFSAPLPSLPFSSASWPRSLHLHRASWFSRNPIDNDVRICPKYCLFILAFLLNETMLVQDIYSQLECNKRDGIWRIKNINNNEEELTEGNVYCHFGCKIGLYYKEGQCENNEECAKVSAWQWNSKIWIRNCMTINILIISYVAFRE